MSRITALSRVTVRPLGPHDYMVWREARLGRLETPPTQDEYRKILARHRKLAEKFQLFEFAVFDSESGRIVGATDIKSIDLTELSHATLGYSVFEQFWGQGFGSEAARLTLDFAFRQLKLSFVKVEIRADNGRSLAIGARLGFVLSERTPDKDHDADILTFRLLRSQWESLIPTAHSTTPT